MNSKAKTIFQLVGAAAEKLKTEVVVALDKYRSERAAAQAVAAKFKNENEEFESRRNLLAAEAREKITKAHRVFRNQTKEAAEKLRDELKLHIAQPLSRDFMDQLAMIRDYGLKVTRTELETLIAQNSGNSLGLAALSSVMKKNGVPFRLSYISVADFEKDINVINDLADGLLYIPMDYHHEGCDVFKNEKCTYYRKDGSSYQNGQVWDSVGILTVTNIFEAQMKEIAQMGDRWAADASYPRIDEISREEREEAQRLDPEAELPNEPKPATTVEDVGKGVAIAKQLAQEAAAGHETYNKVSQTYMR